MGLTTVKIICATPQTLLSRLNEHGIAIYNIQYRDDLTVVISVRNRDIHNLQRYADRTGCSVEIMENCGLPIFLKRIFSRPVLVAGCMIWVFLLLYLPTRVLFIEVKGNHTVPTKMIVEKAEQCGVSFGASRRGIRNEQIKNRLISQIPGLQWVGVNTYGCVAVISVEEKTEQETNTQRSDVSSIVACHEGIISDITVERGNPTCSVGQVVTEGQTLISGFTDCGLSIKAEHASGTVYATTIREINAVAPYASAIRPVQTTVTKKYSLKIGKNIINLSKDSGISDTTCAKIHTEWPLTLPGGFVLPISLICEEYTDYLYSLDADEVRAACPWLPVLAENYLLTQTVDTTLLSRDYSCIQGDGAVYFKGLYYCREMIGRKRYEEI